MTRVCEKAKQDEQLKMAEVAELRAKVQKLKGESEYIKTQHQEARSKFAQANGGVSTGELSRDLYKMDRDRHAKAMGDVAMKPENQPIWKDYDFLERNDTTKDR